MRLLYIFSFVLLFTTTSIGQSFTLLELIKMSKMDVDNFDSYVTARGYVFLEKINDPDDIGVQYAFDLSYDKSKAQKNIILYQKNSDNKYALRYVSANLKEYYQIKKSIKSSGYELFDNYIFKDDDGIEFNKFFFVNTRLNIKIFLSVSSDSFNIRIII